MLHICIVFCCTQCVRTEVTATAAAECDRWSDLPAHPHALTVFFCCCSCTQWALPGQIPCGSPSRGDKDAARSLLWGLPGQTRAATPLPSTATCPSSKWALPVPTRSSAQSQDKVNTSSAKQGVRGQIPNFSPSVVNAGTISSPTKLLPGQSPFDGTREGKQKFSLAQWTLPGQTPGGSSDRWGKDSTPSAACTLPVKARSDALSPIKTSASKAKWALPGQTPRSVLNGGVQESTRSVTCALSVKARPDAQSRGRNHTRSSTWALGQARRGSLNPETDANPTVTLRASGTGDNGDGGGSGGGRGTTPTVKPSCLTEAVKAAGAAAAPRSILKTAGGYVKRRCAGSNRVRWRENLVQEDVHVARARQQRAAKWLRPKREGSPAAAPRPNRVTELAHNGDRADD